MEAHYFHNYKDDPNQHITPNTIMSSNESKTASESEIIEEPACFKINDKIPPGMDPSTFFVPGTVVEIGPFFREEGIIASYTESHYVSHRIPKGVPRFAGLHFLLKTKPISSSWQIKIIDGPKLLKRRVLTEADKTPPVSWTDLMENKIFDIALSKRTHDDWMKNHSKLFVQTPSANDSGQMNMTTTQSFR